MEMQKITDMVTHPAPAAGTACGVIAAYMSGITLSGIATFTSIVYMCILIAHKIYTWRYELKQGKPCDSSE